jgi:hypothetical protein
MNTHIFIPSSLRMAAQCLRVSWQSSLSDISKRDFVRLWSSVAYLYPGLHPDGFDETDSGWPTSLKRIAGEAWRRAEACALTDEELYPSDAQWAGIYDRLTAPTKEETARRQKIAKQMLDIK